MSKLKDTIKYTQNLKLLYVEDNVQSRESTLLILEDFFDEIVVVHNGEAGLHEFKTNKISEKIKNFDLIITDINMPKLNGLQMIEKIRKIDINISILVLSAYNESDFFLDSIKQGVDGYLLKPINVEQFLSILGKVVEKRKLKDEAERNLHFLHQYQELTDKSAIVSKTDLQGIITYANDEFCKISEYTRDELIAANHNIVRHPDNSSSIYKVLWETIKDNKQIWHGVLKNISKNGKIYYVKSTIKPILDENNNILEFIALRDDITEIMNPKKKLQDCIENLKKPLVVYLKLEEFKTLEELYDTVTVEKIQDEFVKYLEKYLPKECLFKEVYQLGNGEYAMTSENDLCMQNKEDFIKKLKKYQDTIEEGSIDIFDLDYDMSVILSFAYKDDEVLQSAKLGIKKLLKSKQDFIISNNFAQIERDKANKNMKTISLIKTAINALRIVSYFQPIINNKTKKREKYESLVRLIDEYGEILTPDYFLDTAKKGKYYRQITNIVLENSFAVLKSTDMDISINLSALDIEKKSTRDKIFYLLEEHKKDASRVIFELLEDENIKDFNAIRLFISDVKKLGVKIAIDDFGTGYSNFERLLDYQPDILKIDGSLIKNIERSSYAFSLVRLIVAFAKEQKIETIAEFVENENIFNIVNELGVDYSQGYHFGKPAVFQVH